MILHELKEMEKFYNVLFTSQFDDEDLEFDSEDKEVTITFCSDYYLVELKNNGFGLDNLKNFDVGQFTFRQSCDENSELLSVSFDTYDNPIRLEDAFRSGNEIEFCGESMDKYDLDNIISLIPISNLIK